MGIVNDQTDQNARTDATKDGEILSEISFEVFDASVLTEIKEFFLEHGNPNFNEFLEQVNPLISNANGRTESCKNVWTHRVWSDGRESMHVCSNCSGEWECMYYYYSIE